MRRSNLLKMIDEDMNQGGPITTVLDNKLDKHLIAGRLLAAGATHREVAEQTGYHPAYITKLRRHPSVVGERQLMHNRARDTTAQIQEEVIRGSVSGLAVLNNILTEGTPESEMADLRLKARVAQDFLDREGTAPKVTRSQAQSQSVSVHLDSNDIAFLKEKAAKRKEA